jgi:putative tricarboxylic transport membrane protein
MDFTHSVILGFQTSLQPINLFYCFVGVLIGTLVGVLPGIGPTGAMAILLPVTFHVPPLSTVIMLAGIYYGAMYGGSTTSILVNIPGEPASIITTLDGYKMAREGKAHIKGLLPSVKDWADSIWAIIRGTILGFFLGMLPGGGALLASFV